MIEYLSYNLEDLFAELKDRARAEGAYSQEAWDDLVEEIIDEHVRVGEIEDDDELQSMREALRARFPDFSAEIK